MSLGKGESECKEKLFENGHLENQDGDWC